MTDPYSTPPNPPQTQGYLAPHATAVPVAALPYSLPLNRRRPGLVTAIGVISIIVACFSGLASLMTGCQAAGYYMISSMGGAMRRAQAHSFSTIATPGIPSAPNATPSGLDAADRQVVISTLSAMQPLNTERTNQLDAYLTTDGTSIFPTAGTALTAQRVRRGVSSSYTHESTGHDDLGNAVFVTPWGTLKVYDARADFSPTDGSAVRTASANSSSDTSAGTATNAGASSFNGNGSASTTTALTPAEARAAVQKAQQASGNKLTTAQLNALTAALQDPNQQLIAPGTAWSPIRSVNVGGDGSAWVMFSGGYVALDPQGKTSGSSSFNGNGMPAIGVSGIACGLAIADAAISICLAIFLLVAGINVLGQSLAGRRLHRIFALIKIPLCIAGTAALCVMNYQFYSSFAGMTPGGGSMPAAMAIGWGGIVGGCGLIYPIALLIALRSRTIRDYYNAVRE